MRAAAAVLVSLAACAAAGDSPFRAWLGFAAGTAQTAQDCKACSPGDVCCNPNDPVGLCPGGIKCCDCGSGSCVCPTAPAPTPAPAPKPTPAPAPPPGPTPPTPPSPTPSPGSCNECAAGDVCCDPSNPKQVCPDGTHCCQCGKAACACPPPTPQPPTPVPTPAPPLTPPPQPPTSCGDYWYEKTSTHGTAFRNVKDYGAKGDGVTDDTAALQAALTSGRKDERSTKQPAVVYMPAGTYVIKDTLYLYFYTHLVGNPLCPPKILMAPFTAATTRVYAVEGPKSCKDCGHTDDFYYGLRNLVIDVTEPGNDFAVGLHWTVSQATELRGVTIYAKGAEMGMFGESGSGGFLGDLVVDGGHIGIVFGNQQWTFRNVTVRNTEFIGVQVLWNWVFTWVGLKVEKSPVGFQYSGAAGGLILADAEFVDVGTAIWTDWDWPNSSRSIVFDRATFTRVTNITSCYLTPEEVCKSAEGKMSGNPTGSVSFRLWYQGLGLKAGKLTTANFTRAAVTPVRPDTPHDQRPRPAFGSSGKVANARDAGCKGDGVTDDTAALQKVIDASDEVFLPYGTYLISDTVNLGAHTKLVGEAYTVLMAKRGAAAFADASNPKPMVATADDPAGTAMLADLMFMVEDESPGCVLLEWRVGRNSGMWDVHHRMMHGAHTLLKVTGGGGGYFENMWGWVADHDMDTGSKVTVKNPRGFLAEGTRQLMHLYSVAYEHSSLYQFNFSDVQGVHSFVTQTESPYWQTPPTAWGTTITNSQDIYSYGNGYYNWFLGVQSDIFNVRNSTNVNLFVPNVNVPNAGRPDMGVAHIVSGDHPVKVDKIFEDAGFCAHFAMDIGA